MVPNSQGEVQKKAQSKSERMRTREISFHETPLTLGFEAANGISALTWEMMFTGLL